jgi:hypothetical protein
MALLDLSQFSLDPQNPFGMLALPRAQEFDAPIDSPRPAGDLPSWIKALASVPVGIGTNVAPDAGPRPRPPNAPSADEIPNVPLSLAPPLPSPDAPQPRPPSFSQQVKSRLETIAGILSPEMRARQAENQTAAALKSRGLPPEIADAAARNPELLRQVAAQLFGPKQLQRVVLRDAQGNPVALTFDASTGQYRDANGNPLAPGAFAPRGNPAQAAPRRR